MRRIVCAMIILSFLAGIAMAKTERTFYTDERIATGRANVAKYDWAKKIQKRIFETGDPIVYYIGPEYTAADKFAAQSDEFLWLLQPPTTIGRVVWPRETIARCPRCGDAVKKLSVWNAWRIDPITHPYQVQCQGCKDWFPSNKYHEGDMTSGPFADNGEGCLHEGLRYFFLREYAHMAYGSVVIPTLRSLSQAYLLTGDAKYGRKGAILLARLASEYPNYGWDGDPDAAKLENRFERTYLGPFNNQHPHYDWKKGGMITDLIWETFCLEATAYAYDALYDMMDNAEVLAFVKSKGMPVTTGDDLRRYIETYIFRSAMRGLEAGWIHGNEGFHQAAALAVALVLDDYSDHRPNSMDMINYAYHGTGQSAFMIINSTQRDGGGHESPGYNKIKLDFIRVNRLMEEIRKRHPGRFDSDLYPDLFDNPKARALFDYNIDMLVDGKFIPSIGDSGGLSAPSRVTRTMYSFLGPENLYAVERYNDPRHARACTAPDGSLAVGELWQPYPEAQIQALLAKPESQIVRVSRVLDGYGMGVLESGDEGRRRALCLSYTNLRGHQQQEELFLSFWARGVELLEDIGYPRTWDHRWQFDANSLAHNTVTVDETQSGDRKLGGMGRLFAGANGVQVITASHAPYLTVKLPSGDAVNLYERTVVLVDIDADRFFAVDLFAVGGGVQHDQSWHALLTRPEVPALDWTVQQGGTLAGPDVPEFGTWTDRWGRKRGDFPSYVTEVRRATLAQPAAWTWPTGLPEGDAVRLTMVPLGGPAEVVMGRGCTPVAREQKLDFVLVRRSVAEGAASQFLTLIEGYQKVPVIQDVKLLSESPLVFEVAVAGGVEEITLNIPKGPSRPTSHRPIGVRVRSRRGEAWVRDVRIGACAGDPGYVQTRIAAVDYPTQALAVPATPAHEAAFVAGRTIRVYNPGRSGLYKIVSTRRDGDRLWLTLDYTALFARGRVSAVKQSQVTVGAFAPVSPASAGRPQGSWAARQVAFTFAGGSLDAKGRFSGPCAFEGAWLGEGEAARQLKGATSGGVLVLSKAVGPRALTRDYANKVVSVWEYGPGDSVEVALIAP